MRNNLDLLVGIHNLFLQRYHSHSCSFVWCEIESLCIKRVSVTSVFLFRYTSFSLPESIIMQLLSFPSIFLRWNSSSPLFRSFRPPFWMIRRAKAGEKTYQAYCGFRAPYNSKCRLRRKFPANRGLSWRGKGSLSSSSHFCLVVRDLWLQGTSKT